MAQGAEPTVLVKDFLGWGLGATKVLGIIAFIALTGDFLSFSYSFIRDFLGFPSRFLLGFYQDFDFDLISLWIRICFGFGFGFGFGLDLIGFGLDRKGVKA